MIPSRPIQRAVVFTLPLFVLLLLSSLLAFASRSHAADQTVSICNWATFKGALDSVQAAGGGRVEIACSGVIDFPDRADITRPVTIAALQQVTFTQSNGTINPQFNRHFQVFAGQALTLTGMTLTGAGRDTSNGGSIYLDGGASLRLENVRVVGNLSSGGTISALDANVAIVSSEFVSNTARLEAAGLLVQGGGLSISDTLFIDNVTYEIPALGGALQVRHSQSTLENVTFTGNKGFYGGGALFIGGRALLRNPSFIENEAVSGGAIYALTGAEVEIDEGSFLNNRATGGSIGLHPGRGGAFFIHTGSRITLRSSELLTNQAAREGGAFYVWTSSHLTATATTISLNSAVWNGGAIAATDNARVRLDESIVGGNQTLEFNGGAYHGSAGAWLHAHDTDFVGNKALHSVGGNAGALYQQTGSVFVEGGSFNANQTQHAGGAIAGDNTSIVISGTLFFQNRAQAGGAIYLIDANSTLTETRVISNVAEYTGVGTPMAQAGGGGIALYAGTLSVESSIAMSNSSGVGGAILAINPSSGLILRNSTLQGNDAVYGGGVALWNAGASRLENVTLSGNFAHSDGGGIFLVQGEPATITHATIAENRIDPAATGTKGAGIGTDSGGHVTIRNSVLDNPDLGAPNASHRNCSTNGGSTIGSAGVFATDSSCGAGATTITSTGLTPLADNGGGTHTYLPAVGSPLINGGVAAYGLPTDQRGFSRPSGVGFDVGAVEVQLLNAPTSLTLNPASPAFAGAQPSGTFVGVLSTQDADLPLGERFTYTVVTPSSPFVVGGANGVLTDTLAVGAQPLPRGVHTVTVRSTDLSGLFADTTFTVTVANRPPVALSLDPPTPHFAAPPAANTVVGVLATSDPDSALHGGETFTYAILTAGSPFIVGGATGVVTDTLRVGGAALTSGVHTVVVRATDSGGASVNATFTVTVASPPPALALTLDAPTTVFTGSVAAGTSIGTLVVTGGDGSENFVFSVDADAVAGENSDTTDNAGSDSLFVIGGEAKNQLQVGSIALPVGSFEAAVTATGSANSTVAGTFMLVVHYDGVSMRWLPMIADE